MRFDAAWWARWRVFLVTLVVAVVLLGVLYAVWYRSPASGVTLPPQPSRPATSWVQIDDLDIEPEYTTTNTSDTSYLSSAAYIDCEPCPTNVTPGGVYNFSFNLTDNDTRAHSITGIQILSPFVLLSESPVTPYVFHPHETTVFTIEVRVPDQTGDYDIQGGIETT
jgi:hypothetical protein